MKILLLTNKIPFPPNSGYAIVVYNTIKELVANGCKVTLFSLCNSTDEFDPTDIQDPLFHQIRFVQSKIDGKMKIKDTLWNIFSHQSYNLNSYYDAKCAEKISRLLHNHKFDVIQFEGLFLVPYLEVIRSACKTPVVYRAHNVEHQIWKKLTLNESSFFKRLYMGFQSSRMKKYENKVLNNFDQIISVSAVDEHFFSSIGCVAPVRTIPVSVDPEIYEHHYKLSSHKSIGYIGTMDWQPNVEGLNWFMEEVWPAIKQLDSGIVFHLAGKNIPREYHHQSDPALLVEGEVESALEFIARQHVFIVPLLSGSGMRVKIIEAMALGKCVIATSIAAEGIHYLHDKNILIADKADDFYKQILRCFTDKNLVNRIGQQAKKLVERNHHNKNCGKSLLAVYRELCDNRQ